MGTAMVLLERFPLRRRLSDVVKNCFGIDSWLEFKKLIFERIVKAAKTKVKPDSTFFTNDEIPTFFSIEDIKSLHKIMANDLLSDDAGVLPGEFRIDQRYVGDENVTFPAPENVSACMETFVKSSKELILKAFSKRENAFESLATITHQFVRIHPFPDFNGRMSRLILFSMLNALSFPFPISLRGDKKGRHRYLTALRKANRGQIRAYAALIAMRVFETFQEFEQNLKLCGLEPLIKFNDNEA